MQELKDELRRILKGRVAIVGVGNVMRGDDGFGAVLVRILKRRVNSERILLIDAEMMPENYGKKIREFKPEKVLIIDAVDFNSSPGDVVIFGEDAIKENFMSTHKIPLSVFASFLRRDTRAEFFFLGVQPKKIELGEKMSKEVARATKLISAIFLDILTSSAPSPEDP